MTVEGFVPSCLPVILLFAACGARTGLNVGVEVVTDAGCTSDDGCNDGIDCTLDQCDPKLHVCTHTLRDALCDDGVFCDGVERCDVARGCVSVALSCDDGVACTDDTCNETKRACVHEPNDSECPISQACDVTNGCEQRAFVHDQQTLFDVRLPSGVVKTIGPTNFELTDVALAPNNTLYGLTFDGLLSVSQSTGQASLVVAISTDLSLNGADFAPDGTFFVGGGSSLFTLDPSSGALTEVAEFPPPLNSSGDIAFVGTRLLATGAGSEDSDELVEFDLVSSSSVVIGPVGFHCVWGLSSYGTSLYGFTCDGDILAIDTGTGAGKLIVHTPRSFWGASAR